MGSKLKVTLLFTVCLFAMFLPVVLVTQLGESLSPTKVQLSPLTRKVIGKFCREHHLAINPDLQGAAFISTETGEPIWLADVGFNARR